MALQLRQAAVGNRQVIAPQPLIGLASTIALVNRRYSGRFVPETDLLAAGIGWEVVTFATADDPCDVGIFNAAGAVLLASSGATLGKMNTSNGVKYLPFVTPVQLAAGTPYYASLSYGTVGGTAATLRMTSTGGVLDGLFGKGSAPAVGVAAQMVQTSAHPLVAPLTYTVTANAPFLAICE